MVFHLVDEVLERVFENAKSNDPVKGRKAPAGAVRAGIVARSERRCATLAGAGTGETIKVPGAGRAEHGGAVGGIVASGADAGVAKVEYLSQPALKQHGGQYTDRKPSKALAGLGGRLRKARYGSARGAECSTDHPPAPH